MKIICGFLNALIFLCFIFVSIVPAAEIDDTKYVLKGEIVPFTGYIVAPSRFEKVIVAIADLQSTKEAYQLRTQLYELTLKQKELAEQKLEMKTQESEAVEEKLEERIAELDVWYLKPWFVSTSTAVLFIVGLLAL